MSLHTIFFDLDGTLTDSAPGILNCVRYALERMGLPADERVTAENFIGPPLAESFCRLYDLPEAEGRRALEIYRERFSTIGLFENSVYEGIPEALKKLKQSGKTLVVATGKPEVYTLRILDHFDLSQYFTHVSGCLLSGEREQKIDVLRHALSLCGLDDGAGCAMVGDRATDIAAGQTCGMLGIGVLYGGGTREELQQAHADRLVEDPAELAELLLQL